MIQDLMKIPTRTLAFPVEGSSDQRADSPANAANPSLSEIKTLQAGLMNKLNRAAYSHYQLAWQHGRTLALAVCCLDRVQSALLLLRRWGVLRPSRSPNPAHRRSPGVPLLKPMYAAARLPRQLYFLC
eukprot:scaffold649525_cov45-Prasinocladus_malaysianus.AAC.1